MLNKTFFYSNYLLITKKDVSLQHAVSPEWGRGHVLLV